MTSSQPLDSASDQRKIRYAVVGLGWFAQTAALPAFAQTENSELTALISDDPVKMAELAERYGGAQRTFSYEEYDDCLSSGLIDAVYIALPNHLHCDYTVRAGRQGIHVLCEKPMAVTAEECERMIQACEQGGAKLMIAYRLHLEPANLEAIDIVQSGQIGEPRLFNSVFSQQVEQGNIRLQDETGGGTLGDIGIYCINAARYLFQAEPIEAFAIAASQKEPRFQEVAEMTSAILRFPDDRVASFTCSFGGAKVSRYDVVGTKGDLHLDPAYAWDQELKYALTINGETQEKTFPLHSQLAAEFTYFSDCILQNKDPEPSGKEGLIDVRIIQALHQSIEQGQPIPLELPTRSHRPTPAQTVKRPSAQEKPDLVHASSPGGQ